jgi:hypothetical protein
MADRGVPREYVCARWAYSELLSTQPYHGSELVPLREKLARGVPFDELEAVERSLLLRKWHEVRGVPACVKRLQGIVAFQLSVWTKEQLGAAYVMTYFAQQVSRNPLVDRALAAGPQWTIRILSEVVRARSDDRLLFLG